ncbi:Hypothetical Protein FCC1311_103552 [Hondaea fermentalgiana]|uniref:Thioredoxin domain-containing protein n=1 Tax=Hondaea fermentalgiana TaxID=2315210 RepID=A0A2R5H064_9STRA|nr:Hypothetical Protein FCC1311_103552 [Hondaea fermentalgiana]|eukprot:GBG34131.1 Hypothetical Protein FCC1311_103552 [Hondaea fermentalgiana]
MAEQTNTEALEAQVKDLELENKKKDEIIEQLEGSGSSGADAAAPPKPPATEELSDEAKELLTYDDDPAIGAKAPSLEPLKFKNGDAFDVGQGKPVVVTFHCNLNKSDFVTLAVLSDIYKKYEGKVNFVSISRDHDEADVEKWLKKYQGAFMAEMKGPNGEAGVTQHCDFQMAFDPEHKVNAEFKTALKRAVVGVGLAIIIDQEGTIRWLDTFVRGDNKTKQFEYQLNAIINGTELLSNGKAPEVEEEEEEGGAAIPDDVDFLGGGSGNY